MALLDRITALNRRLAGRDYYRFYTNNVAVGFVDTQLLPDLSHYLARDLFAINAQARRVDCRFPPDQHQAFETAIELFFRNYFAKYHLRGWRDERYAVSAHFADEPLFLIERAALSFLGITGYGVHVNGYVEDTNGIHLWVAKRSEYKSTDPGKYDQIAAGGLPYGITALENVIKECEEEASIPRHLAKQATPVSVISYAYDLSIGLRPDVIFNYDLRLPADFTPQPNDNEVASFQLIPLSVVLNQLETTQDFKFNSAAAVIDFAIRHGVINPEHPDYYALCTGLNRREHHLGI